MSQENVEIVRAAVDAFIRRDWGAVFNDAAPDFELDLSRSIGPYRGVYPLDQTRRFLEDFAATFEAVRLEPLDYIDSGDYVVVPLSTHFVGRDGVEATTGGAQLWTIHEGTVRCCGLFQTKADALEAAGLSE